MKKQKKKRVFKTRRKKAEAKIRHVEGITKLVKEMNKAYGVPSSAWGGK